MSSKRLEINRIYLIGFMGSGKSTIGKMLAQYLQLAFYDMDTLIEAKAQKTINEIFTEEGENEFRLIEKDVLHKTEQLEKAIIATGGGAPCHFDNMDWIGQHGMSLYLRASPFLIAQRLRFQQSHRPLIKELNDDELLDFIDSKLMERSPFYEQADMIYDQDERTAAAMASELALYVLNLFP